MLPWRCPVNMVCGYYYERIVWMPLLGESPPLYYALRSGRTGCPAKANAACIWSATGASRTWPSKIKLRAKGARKYSRIDDSPQVSPSFAIVCQSSGCRSYIPAILQRWYSEAHHIAMRCLGRKRRKRIYRISLSLSTSLYSGREGKTKGRESHSMAPLVLFHSGPESRVSIIWSAGRRRRRSCVPSFLLIFHEGADGVVTQELSAADAVLLGKVSLESLLIHYEPRLLALLMESTIAISSALPI